LEKKIKAVVIGLGRMGAEPSLRLYNNIPEGWLPISHIEALLSIPEIEIVGICDIDKIKVNKYCEIYGIKNGYTDYEEMLSVNSPELVCIATRTLIRKEIIYSSSKYGAKFIYAEKPLCNSLKDVKEVIKFINKNNICLFYGVNRRYHYMYRKAKSLILKGEIGELKEIHIENGLTNLMWSHPHSTDLLVYFSNSTEIDYIQAKCIFDKNNVINDVYIDDDPLVEHVFLKFKNGIKGIINNASGINLRLCGTKGNLTVHSDGKMISCFKGDEYFNDITYFHEVTNESATVIALKELISTNGTYNKTILPDEIICGFEILTGIIQSSMNNSVLIKRSDINDEIFISGKFGFFFT
jgi:scyllo-inositol 2-dehydrogenase (NAD+)